MDTAFLVEDFLTPTPQPELDTQADSVPEQPLEDYLAQFEAEYELWDEYYHACGRW